MVTIDELGQEIAELAVHLDDNKGTALSIGRRTRSIPPAIRRAIILRDRGCAFPGCTHDRFVHGHHIQHWLHGGVTSVDNLTLLCTHHHHLVHEGGWSVERMAPAPTTTGPWRRWCRTPRSEPRPC